MNKLKQSKVTCRCGRPLMVVNAQQEQECLCCGGRIVDVSSESTQLDVKVCAGDNPHFKDLSVRSSSDRNERRSFAPQVFRSLEDAASDPPPPPRTRVTEPEPTWQGEVEVEPTSAGVRFGSRWVVVALGVFLGCGTLGFAAWTLGQAKVGPESEDRRVASFSSRAYDLLGTALAAPEPEGLGMIARDPARMIPMVRAHYEEFGYQPRELASLVEADERSIDGKTVTRLVVELKDGGQREALFVAGDGGEPLLDWEHFEGFPEKDWSDFVSVRPTRPTSVRAHLRRGLVPPSVLSDLGGASKKGRVVKVYRGDALGCYYALLPDAVDGLADWAEGEDCIVQLRFPSFALHQDTLEIVSVAQTGWVEGVPSIPSNFVGGAADGTQAAELAKRSHASLAKFLAADSVEGKAEHVVDGDMLLETMRDYYGSDVHDRFVARDFKHFDGLVSRRDTERGLSVLVRSEALQNEEDMVLFFRDGKLDWQTYVELKDRELDRFLASEGRSSDTFGTFRVLLMLGRSKFADPSDLDGKPQLVVTSLTGTSWMKLPVRIPKSEALLSELYERLDWGTGQSATVSLAWHELPQGGVELVLEELVCWGLLGVGDEESPGTVATATQAPIFNGQQPTQPTMNTLNDLIPDTTYH